MEVVHARCAGLDISKKDATVCVRVAGAGRGQTIETVTTWSSMTNQVLALRDHLIAEPHHSLRHPVRTSAHADVRAPWPPVKRRGGRLS
jgi:hypothetical protein